MVLSIEELKVLASNLRKQGLNTQQIADELSLSQDTITWLLTGTGESDRPSDVRIGWRTLGVRPQRLAAVGSIMADVADEEVGYDNIDTVVGISINGIAFAYEVARTLESDMTVFVPPTKAQGVVHSPTNTVKLPENGWSSSTMFCLQVTRCQRPLKPSERPAAKWFWPSCWSTKRCETKWTMFRCED